MKRFLFWCVVKVNGSLCINFNRLTNSKLLLCSNEFIYMYLLLKVKSAILLSIFIFFRSFWNFFFIVLFSYSINYNLKLFYKKVIVLVKLLYLIFCTLLYTTSFRFKRLKFFYLWKTSYSKSNKEATPLRISANISMNQILLYIAGGNNRNVIEFILKLLKISFWFGNMCGIRSGKCKRRRFLHLSAKKSICSK